jgi:hypothetical protein
MLLAQSKPVPRITNQSAKAVSPISVSQRRLTAARQTVPMQTSGLNFAPAIAYGSGGSETFSVAVGDFNGDGKLDLVVANADSNTVGVLLGNGDGTFQTAVTYGSGGEQPYSVAVEDFRGDGKLDIVVANQSSCGTCAAGLVGVLLGNGDGTFQTAVTYGSGGNTAQGVAVADMNGDGKPDILVANQISCDACTDGGVGVLLGNGDGTFQTAVTYDSGGNTADSVAVADANGDGKLDLVVANADSNTVGVLLGNGDGTFQTAVTYGSGGSGVYSVAVEDFRGDGKLDIVVANCGISSCSNVQDGSVGVLLGNGDGTFQTAVTYGSGGIETFSVSVGDFNGDGKPDIVVTNCGSSNCSGVQTGIVGVLLGNGDGTFQTAVTYGSGGEQPYSVAVGDFNGDGKPDLVVANIQSSVGVLINVSISTTTTALVSSVNPSGFGQAVTFTATVTSQGFNAKPTGTVNFYDGTTNIGTSNLNSSGVATLMTSTLVLGTQSITATYNGDSNFASSTSAVLSQVVQGAIALLSPTSLNFGNQTVGDGQGYQTVTLTNTGNIALTITSIAVNLSNGGYAQINTCGTSVAAGASCTYSLTWNPAKAGTMTGSITFTDNAPGSPQTVSLTGIGVVPTVTLSRTSLTFATQVVFTTSAAQTVTLNNTGLGILTISKIAVTGPFTQTNTCGTQVAAGGSCTFSVKFKPTTSGTLTGSVSITDNASGSPQKIALSGTGTDIQLTPTSLNFGNQPVGTKSTAKKITLSNKASVSVSVTSISITGTNKKDFAETNTCGTTVKAGASCTITVTFTPSADGQRTADVSVDDNGGGSPQTVGLSGTGTGT